MSKIIDDILLKSNNNINNLDRSILGKFAVTNDELINYEILQNFFSVASDDKTYTKRERDEAYHYSKNFIGSRHPVIAEWMLWNEIRTGRPTLRTTPKGIYALLQRLRKVYAKPEYHDYFCVGIWDTERARQYAAAGIDAELALQLEA